MPFGYTVKIYKSWNVRNAKAAWVNNYIFAIDGDVRDAGVQPLIEKIVEAERFVHLNRVNFLRAVISTTTKEPEYDPLQLRVFELNAVGSRTIPEDDNPLDLNICLKAKKVVSYGRAGTMFFRGCLRQSDVLINDRGESQLNPASDLMSPVVLANVNGLLTQHAGFATWILPEADELDEAGELASVRSIAGIAVAGVSISKRDHKYFDRANAGGGAGGGGAPVV